MACFKCRSNILLDQHLSAKLGDFGFAQEISKLMGNYSLITAPMVAMSLGYTAPEMLQSRISPKSDVYSYGVVSAYLHKIRHIIIMKSTYLCSKCIENLMNYKIFYASKLSKVIILFHKLYCKDW